MKTTKEFRMKWRALDQQWQKGKLNLTELNEKQDALLESYSRTHAIDFLNYCSCIEDFDDPNGLDKENIRIYNEWINQQTKP